jgi:penicillin-binding protein 1A
MAQGYAMLANGGHAVKPYVIDAIYGPEGETLYRADPAIVCDACVPQEPAFSYGDEPGEELTLDEMVEIAAVYQPDATTAPELFEGINIAPQAISPQNAFLIQDMMRDVVRAGTGRRAMALGRNDLSGKTGTSNDRRDAWFGGFNADIATIVWVGYDDDLPLARGEEGSRTALPIWVEFSRIALKGVPENQMPMPDGIVSVLIDRESGCPARAGQRNVIFEVFREGQVPECEATEDVVDPFNNASGIDPEPEEEQEESETLF